MDHRNKFVESSLDYNDFILHNSGEYNKINFASGQFALALNFLNGVYK